MDEGKVTRSKTQTEPEDILVVDDGYIRIPVYNQLKEQIGLFKFNPTDINIVNRYNEVAEKFGDVVKPLSDTSINETGEAADERMIELFDYMLGTDSKEAFFSQVHVFTPIGGNFYCENVFKAIGVYLEKKFSTEIKKIDARLDKHIHGYRTGKHKRGDR